MTLRFSVKPGRSAPHRHPLSFRQFPAVTQPGYFPMTRPSSHVRDSALSLAPTRWLGDNQSSIIGRDQRINHQVNRRFQPRLTIDAEIRGARLPRAEHIEDVPHVRKAIVISAPVCSAHVHREGIGSTAPTALRQVSVKKYHEASPSLRPERRDPHSPLGGSIQLLHPP